MKLYQDQFGNFFQKAKMRYPELGYTAINLTFNKRWFFTMQAQMTFASIFSKRRKYVINVNPRRQNILLKLSEDDIMGWFGHELAHVIDYERMSNTEILVFIFRYIIDFGFRFSIERRINAYAYNNGFAKELFCIWKIFLVMGGVNKKYQNYIIRNYAPYWEDIRKTAEREGITEEVFKSFMHQ